MLELMRDDVRARAEAETVPARLEVADTLG